MKTYITFSEVNLVDLVRLELLFANSVSRARSECELLSDLSSTSKGVGLRTMSAFELSFFELDDRVSSWSACCMESRYFNTFR